ncbi:hypothetical protein GCM10022281_09620 [Sphingomonas rosea]|uniref:DUF2489 domain-containing protein n=1 Tax=Sphingomonas rosea TaxID=335605 RepID=A0ABP7TVW0_9SPHN
MLEVLGAILLMFLVVTLGLLWLGIRIARRVIRNVRAFAGGFSGAAGGMLPPDPRWMKLSSHLDRRQREAARLARERIRAFLAERGSAALTPEEAQLMISCERRVPELIDTCLERCASARPNERCDYAAPTLERLVRIGEEAEAARAAIRSRDDQRLATMHRYFDAVATRDPA